MQGQIGEQRVTSLEVLPDLGAMFNAKIFARREISKAPLVNVEGS